MTVSLSVRYIMHMRYVMHVQIPIYPYEYYLGCQHFLALTIKDIFRYITVSCIFALSA